MKNDAVDCETLYKSKKTGKVFTSKEDLIASDAEYDKAHKAEIERAENRKKEADKVEAARQNWVKVSKDCEKQVSDAKKAYYDTLRDFNKQYGCYHQSISNEDLDDIFSWFWSL